MKKIWEGFMYLNTRRDGVERFKRWHGKPELWWGKSDAIDWNPDRDKYETKRVRVVVYADE